MAGEDVKKEANIISHYKKNLPVGKTAFIK